MNFKEEKSGGLVPLENYAIESRGLPPNLFIHVFSVRDVHGRVYSPIQCWLMGGAFIRCKRRDRSVFGGRCVTRTVRVWGRLRKSKNQWKILQEMKRRAPFFSIPAKTYTKIIYIDSPLKRQSLDGLNVFKQRRSS